jgi:hypothetical protein
VLTDDERRRLEHVQCGSFRKRHKKELDEQQQLLSFMVGRGPPVQRVERFIDPSRGSSSGSGSRFSVSNLTASDKSMHFKNLKQADGDRTSLPQFYSSR